MNESQQPFDEETRRRRLDALFADEPFLSPTMKARRLHEKLSEGPGRELPIFDPPTPPAVAPKPRPMPKTRQKAKTAAVPSHAAKPAEGMSLAEAAAFLRAADTEGEDTTAEAACLRRFRQETLQPWLAYLPHKDNLA